MNPPPETARRLTRLQWLLLLGVPALVALAAANFAIVPMIVWGGPWARVENGTRSDVSDVALAWGGPGGTRTQSVTIGRLEPGKTRAVRIAETDPTVILTWSCGGAAFCHEASLDLWTSETAVFTIREGGEVSVTQGR